MDRSVVSAAVASAALDETSGDAATPAWKVVVEICSIEHSARPHIGPDFSNEPAARIIRTAVDRGSNLMDNSR
jgi:hypothetical protein